jgi:hypothetical protein
MITRPLSPDETRRLRADQARLIAEESAAAARLAKVQDALHVTTTKLNESQMLTKFRSISELAASRLDQSDPTIDVSEMTPEQKARAIVEAGQRRRGELKEPEPEMNETAKAILAAGRKRRNEED